MRNAYDPKANTATEYATEELVPGGIMRTGNVYNYDPKANTDTEYATKELEQRLKRRERGIPEPVPEVEKIYESEPLQPWKQVAPRPAFESKYPIAPHVPRGNIQPAKVNMGHINQMMNKFGPGEGQTVLSKALRSGATPVPGQSGEYNG
jgi:hypothetical protein